MRKLFYLLFILICSTAFAALPPVGIQDESDPAVKPVFTIKCTGDAISCSHSGTTGTIQVNSTAGASVGLDLADDDSNESSGITEFATSGDTNSIFTEPAADKLLVDLSNNWPSSDTADALSANGANCSAGSYPLGVDAAGAVESCTAAPNDDQTLAEVLTSGNVAGTTIDMNGNSIILDADGDSSITVDTDDKVDIEVGGTDRLKLVGNGATASGAIFTYYGLLMNGADQNLTSTNQAQFGVESSADLTGDQTALFNMFLTGDQSGASSSVLQLHSQSVTSTDGFVLRLESEDADVGLIHAEDAGENEVFKVDYDGTILSNSLTASELLITDASKNIVSAPVATYPSLTELTYVKGATSAIQTQLNAKEGTLTNEAGLYSALSDVTDFVQGAEVNSINSEMYVDGSIDSEHMGTTFVTGLAAVGTFASGDTFICNEAGVGLRECDYDDLPAGGGGGGDFFFELQPQQAKLPSSNSMGIDAGNNKWRGLFDDTTDECARWETVAYPLTGTLKAKIFYSAVSATSGTAAFDVSVECTTDADARDFDTDSFGTVDSLTGTVAGTAGYLDVLSDASLNEDSCAEHDTMVIKVCRDADGSDTVTGDLEFRKGLIYAE